MPKNISHSLRMFVVILLVQFASVKASAYTPLPWDEEPVEEDTETKPKKEDTNIRRVQNYSRGKERMTYAFIRGAYLSPQFTGMLDGLTEGEGGSVEMPATVLVWVLYGLFSPANMASFMQKNAWLGGMAGRLKTAPVFDEAAFTIGYSKSAFSDIDFGGLAAIESYSVGMTLGGPSPSKRLKGTLHTGWEWGKLEFDSRSSLNVSGPVLGVGMEFRLPMSENNNVLGLGCELRRSWLSGLDGMGGRMHTMQDTLRLTGTLYW